jgi:hypothetical protein
MAGQSSRLPGFFIPSPLKKIIKISVNVLWKLINELSLQFT